MPLTQVFRVRAIEREGKVVGCWYTVDATVEETPFEERRAHYGYGGWDDHRLVDLAARERDLTRTWCTGIAMMLGPRDATATWFRYEAGMDDREVEWRACKGEMREGEPRLRDEPRFGECVRDLALLRSEGWRNSRPGMALETFDAGRGDRVGRGEAFLAMRERAGAFLATLDMAALLLVDGGHEAILKGPWWGIAAGMGRGAPMLAALGRHPHLRNEVLRAWQYRCTDLAEAMADGTELAMLSDFLLSTRKGETSHGADLALAEAACAASPVDWESDPVGRNVPYDLPSAFKAVIRVTGDAHKPRDVAGWSAALGAASGIYHASSSVAGRAEAMSFLDVGNDWAAWGERIRKASGGRPVGMAVDDLRDVTKAFERQLLAPALLLAGRDGPGTPYGNMNDQVAGSLLWSGRRLRRCLELSAQWHARRPAMDGALARLPQPVRVAPEAPAERWAAGLPGIRCGELEIVVLTDVRQLADEGRHGLNEDGTEGLGHCVSGYGPECRTGRHRIVSIRRRGDDGFGRLSTAEILVDGSGERFEVRQHRGHNNRIPVRRAAALLDEYMAGLADGSLTVDRAAFARLPGARSHANPADEAGYDWKAGGAWEEASRLWQPYLPRTLRGLSPADWSAIRLATSDEDWSEMAYWRPLPWERGEPALAFPGYGG